MPSVGLSPNDADEEYIQQFDKINEGETVELLFDHGREFNDMFEDNRIDCTVTDVDVIRTIATIEMEYKSHTIQLRVRALESGRTDLSLKVDGLYGGTPMELSW